MPRMDVGPSASEEMVHVWSTVVHRLDGDDTVELTDDPSRVDMLALSGFLSRMPTGLGGAPRMTSDSKWMVRGES